MKPPPRCSLPSLKVCPLCCSWFSWWLGLLNILFSERQRWTSAMPFTLATGDTSGNIRLTQVDFTDNKTKPGLPARTPLPDKEPEAPPPEERKLELYPDVKP